MKRIFTPSHPPMSFNAVGLSALANSQESTVSSQTVAAAVMTSGSTEEMAQVDQNVSDPENEKRVKMASSGADVSSFRLGYGSSCPECGVP